MSYDTIAGKEVSKAVGSKQAIACESMKEKTLAVVVNAKDDIVKMTSEEVKEKVMKNVSCDLNMRVRAVRKTRSDGPAMEADRENDVRMRREK